MRTHVFRLMLAALIGATLLLAPHQSAPAASSDRPNILLIVTDDMTAADLRYMPRTRRMLGQHGVAMSNFLSNHPLCCPARAEILTGQYAHNNGVHFNVGPWGGFDASDPDHNVAVWLQRAGYQTAFVGKYLNHYFGEDGLQPGWTEFNPTTANQYAPYGFSALYNGDEQVVENIHTTDWVRRQTNNYIRKFVATGEPFFIYSSQLAPHGMHVNGKWVPPVPAPRHEGMFQDVKPLSFKSPSYNRESYITKGAAWVRRHRMITLNRRRLQSLQAVDEANAAAIQTLKNLGQLDNTYIFFTSDNGYHLGEHRHIGKNLPYNESMSVPLLVRGPGIPVGAQRSQVSAHIDLAPTFLALAGATADEPVDGSSLMPVLRSNARHYAGVLIQNGSADKPWSWRGVRTSRYTYVRYGSRVLMFDRRKDPYELRNVAGRAEYRTVQRGLASRYLRLRDCEGASCRSAAR